MLVKDGVWVGLMLVHESLGGSALPPAVFTGNGIFIIFFIMIFKEAILHKFNIPPPPSPMMDICIFQTNQKTLSQKDVHTSIIHLRLYLISFFVVS